MTRQDLMIPRRLAIHILHAAQSAKPQSIAGEIAQRNGTPAAFILDGQALPEGHAHWADLRSEPNRQAVPSADELTPDRRLILVSLDTKGVLQMRGWELHQGQPQERVLKIIE
ncbi:MAG: hypothetical protein ACPGZP_06505 [Panacagrimonas sp.]